MDDTPGLMKMVHDAARHAAARQSHIARNVANADTPGYRATDISDFAAALGERGQGMKATRPTHLPPAANESAGYVPFLRGGEAAPNGNDVSLENEMMQGVSAQTQHSTALSIYSSARQILATSLGRR